MLDPEIVNLFNETLKLNSYLDSAGQSLFWDSIKSYMQHCRNEQLGGRTYDYVSTKLNQLMTFFQTIDLSEKEIIMVIQEFPSILNSSVSDIYYKYLLLGVIDSNENLNRKDRLINNPKDFITGLSLVYARYCLMVDLNYPQITYSNLFHDSAFEFASKFVKKKYNKPYQIFNNIDELTSEKLIEKYPLDEQALLNMKTWPENQEIVAKFEMIKR